MLSGARIATLAGFLAIAAIAAFAASDRWRAGVPSATLVPDGPASNTRFIVGEAPATSALHRGDRVEIDDPSIFARLQYHALATGSELRVRRTFPLPEVTLSDPIVAAPGWRLALPVLAVEALFLSIAAVIAARGRSSGSLQLAWLFALVVLLVNPTTPSWADWLVLAYGVLGGTIAAVAFVCAADFASRFTGAPNAGWARQYRRIAFALGLFACLLSVGVSAQSFLMPTTPVVAQYGEFGTLVAQAVLFLIGLGIGFAKTEAAERQKALWVVASLAIGIVGFVGAFVAEFAGVREPLRDVPLLLLIAMPLGCAYAILRYRLLDIAFVINRATVFGVTSLLVLAALALVDFGLQSLLGSWLVRTGMYVQLALALAIGIATRPLHGRVDVFVDDLFFRARHEAERNMRQFVRDVAHIDDSGVVLERTIHIVARSANLRCSVFMANAQGFGCAGSSESATERHTIDRNDGAVVRMLTTRAPVDLHDVETALAGDFAFPMFARDRLLGLLVCDGKIDGVAAYAPDELDAIGAVAHAAGVAIDLLRIEALERELESYRTNVSYLSPLRRP